jgi:hypothetical protein
MLCTVQDRSFAGSNLDAKETFGHMLQAVEPVWLADAIVGGVTM